MSESRAHEGAPATSRLDTVGWALAFIWAVVAMLANVGWAWLLIGLGAIVLGMQAALRIFERRASFFWIACGFALLAGGLWQLFQLMLPLTPLLLILVGLAILFGALRRT